MLTQQVIEVRIFVPLYLKSTTAFGLIYPSYTVIKLPEKNRILLFFFYFYTLYQKWAKKGILSLHIFLAFSSAVRGQFLIGKK